MSCFDVKILDPNINTIEIEKCIGDQPASIDIVTYDNTSVLEVSHCIALSSEISGLLESMQDIIGNSGLLAGNYININYDDNTGFTTIAATGLQPSGNYSIVGHNHISSDIINFNAAVSGLIPVKDIVAGNDISITSVSGIYTIDSVVTGVDKADSLITIVFNKTGSIIPKMSVVYINGGQGDMPTVTLAKADSEATSSKTYGITAENIDHMSSGKVIVEGSLGGLNTDQFNPSAPQGNVNGTVVYLSPTVSGGITTTKPSAPYHMVSVGTIVRTHQNEGIIEVRIQNGFELQELHNVAISGVSDGQFLQYNNASGLWLASSSGNFTSLKVNNIDFDTAVSGIVMSILNQFNLIGY